MIAERYPSEEWILVYTGRSRKNRNVAALVPFPQLRKVSISWYGRISYWNGSISLCSNQTKWSTWIMSFLTFNGPTLLLYIHSNRTRKHFRRLMDAGHPSRSCVYCISPIRRLTPPGPLSVWVRKCRGIIEMGIN
ncbi:hypothetical protein CEXT_24971 [Caerostris extrusa]|uniref:Uncharacterized protein n=1 Tax=Caerostris extrusa TaxID=172846 RepID=A0AAV4TLJ1_CAEEX|nr:hypothetical protein CEXT_24971 [Caerostris extrusa]